MGIPSAYEFVDRTQDVLTSRTLGWIEGLPWNATCTPTGDRCSMGLVCKSSICQVLNTTANHLPADDAPPRPIDETTALPSNIGSVCDPIFDTPCSNGIPRVQQGQKYFCVPDSNYPTARWVTQHNFRALFFTQAEEINILGASTGESSPLSPWEYSSRGQNIIDSKKRIGARESLKTIYANIARSDAVSD